MKRSRYLALAASAAALAVPATANAGVLVASAPSCDAQSASQVFLPWADIAQYVLAPGGAAESTDGWSSLSGGASFVSGNEPSYVHGAGDSSSLSLPSGASATTGTMCVGIQHPDLRFFVNGSGLGVVYVSVQFELSDGTVASAPVGSITARSWTLTPVMPIAASLLPLLPGSQTPVRFTFTASGGGFNVDDVYVDPWGGR